jgi:hypothetical protein
MTHKKAQNNIVLIMNKPGADFRTSKQDKRFEDFLIGKLPYPVPTKFPEGTHR